MGSFDTLLSLLAAVQDPRRAEGKLYKLPYVLLFSILAVVSGANSYRGIVTFIRVHRSRLNDAFGLEWKRAPTHTAIRYILQGLDPDSVEQAFRRHAAGLQPVGNKAAQRVIALDGKALKGSFDHFKDRKAAQVLHAFDTGSNLLLAHLDISEKSNEIPAVQKLLTELGLAHHIVTLDALAEQVAAGGDERNAGASHINGAGRAGSGAADVEPTIAQRIQANHDAALILHGQAAVPCFSDQGEAIGGKL